jgi:hypothetical protein
VAWVAGVLLGESSGRPTFASKPPAARPSLLQGFERDIFKISCIRSGRSST